ncbi:MAG: drug/metabolite transporter superfamily permease protein [Fibrobacteres bacterium]|nr:drug/metabolite transporter superfamily permease protein [Fibrobacterota bacterium]
MTSISESRNAKLGLSAVVAASILFSAKSVFFKLCYRYGTQPVVLQALRGAFSLPFYLWPFLINRLRPADRRPEPLSRKDMAIIAWLGFSGYYLASIFDMVGLQYVSAGTERLILFVYPTLVVLFSAWFFRKGIPRSLYLPLCLSYAGIALSFGGEAAGVPGGRPYLGGSLVFLSAVFYALFLVWQGRMVKRIGPQRLAAGCMIVSASCAFVQYLVCYPWSALAQPAPVIGIAAFTSVLCNVVPVYLYGYGVNLVGAGKAAVVSSVGPVSTMLLAGWLLGEGAGVLQVAGLALVVGGTLKLGLGRTGPGRSKVQVAAVLPGSGSASVSADSGESGIPVSPSADKEPAVPPTGTVATPAGRGMA